MCRLLCVHAGRRFEMRPHLERLAEISRRSKEYQGHGWGCAWLEDAGWRLHHDIRPMWEADMADFGETRVLLAHARSAFRDEGIRVENNMPFFDGEHVFIFNGELRGVRIKERGRIGAEKVFNYVKRFDKGDMLDALRRAVAVIQKRTRYVRAMNVVIANDRSRYLATVFNEDPEYFQMRRKSENGTHIVCSEAYPGEEGWRTIDNGAVETF